MHHRPLGAQGAGFGTEQARSRAGDMRPAWADGGMGMPGYDGSPACGRPPAVRLAGAGALASSTAGAGLAGLARGSSVRET